MNTTNISGKQYLHLHLENRVTKGLLGAVEVGAIATGLCTSAWTWYSSNYYEFSHPTVPEGKICTSFSELVLCSFNTSDRLDKKLQCWSGASRDAFWGAGKGRGRRTLLPPEALLCHTVHIFSNYTCMSVKLSIVAGRNIWFIAKQELNSPVSTLGDADICT